MAQPLPMIPSDPAGRSKSDSGDSIPDSPRHWRREHFIPWRKAELVTSLACHAGLSPAQRETFEQLCHVLAASIHFQYHHRLEELKNAYAPFDPDSDTKPGVSLPHDQRHAQAMALFDKFVALLERANFHRLTRQDLQQALGAASDWGVKLHVDFDVFHRLEVFARGDVVGRRVRRRIQNLYRPEIVNVPIYQRLAVIFRLRQHKRLEKHADPNTVYIKLFKNIPKIDMDMLLPGSRVRMSLLDRGRILLPTLSGIGITVFKIIKGVLALAFAGIYGVLLFVGLVGGTIGYGMKSFFGYLRTKDKYQLSLTRNLYYQNLDNNAGVLLRLIDEAEEQEFRETLIAYFLLWKNAGRDGWTSQELDSHAERQLKDLIDVDVDFEVHDALRKLEQFGLAQRLAGDKWRAVSWDDALARMDRDWDGAFNHAGLGAVPERNEESTNAQAGIGNANRMI